jgi:glutathione S-transferase
MLLLRSSPASPFGRKVKIGADLLGLSDRLQVSFADTLDPDETLRRENPLGKIPTLILETGETLYDSRVIIEYLDWLAGGGRIIPEGQDRFPALHQQALADGILDAALLQVYEGRWRSEERRDASWLEYQAGKIDRGLSFAEERLSHPDERIHVGHIAQACALGYLDLRMAGRWREQHPRLVAWLDDFAKRVPAFERTRATS